MRVAPRSKDTEVDDPEPRGPRPQHGGRPDDGGGDAAASGTSRAPPRISGEAALRPAAPPQPQRKRRKRKRGRKVFARDPGAPHAPASPASPAVPAAADAGSMRFATSAAASAVATAAGGVPGEGGRTDAAAGDKTHDGQTVAARSSGQSHGTSGDRPAGGEPYRHPRGPRPARPGDLPVYAALDLGTNNCRLLVAVPTRPGQFRVIDAFSRIVRLGEGLTASGRLGDAAMARAIDALSVCATKLGLRDIRSSRLIATEACRAAENGAEFLARVTEETGLELEIIDRQTEARLAVSGCGSLIEDDTDAVVLFDIGGGSSEIALIDLSTARRAHLASHIVSWTSLPVGVVSLAERFGGRHVTRQIFDDMVADVAAMIEAFEGRNRLGALASGERFHLLGTSGTVTTLAGVHLGLERYDRKRVDGLWLERADVDAMTSRLIGWDFQQRVANPCIGADRADLVLAGCAILEAIRQVWPSQRLRVADRGLREGILTELMAQDGAWRRSRRRGEA